MGTGDILAYGGGAPVYYTGSTASMLWKRCSYHQCIGGGGGRVAVLGLNAGQSLADILVDAGISASGLSREESGDATPDEYVGAPGTVFLAHADGLGMLVVSNEPMDAPVAAATTPLPAFAGGTCAGNTATSLIDASGGYLEDELVGMCLAPDSAALSTCYPTVENTGDTLYIDAASDMGTCSATYGLVYRVDQVHVYRATVTTTESMFVDDTANSTCVEGTIDAAGGSVLPAGCAP